MSVPLCLTDLTMHKVYSVQFISVQSLGCVWLCNPMNHSPPGLSVHQQLRVYPNSCPLSRWCHLTISSSAVPFSSCLQSFSTSGSFQMSQLFSSGGQNIGVSASTSVLPMNTQDWSPFLSILKMFLVVDYLQQKTIAWHSFNLYLTWKLAFLKSWDFKFLKLLI